MNQAAEVVSVRLFDIVGYGKRNAGGGVLRWVRPPKTLTLKRFSYDDFGPPESVLN